MCDRIAPSAMEWTRDGTISAPSRTAERIEGRM
jgi:hypothetical protein